MQTFSSDFACLLSSCVVHAERLLSGCAQPFRISVYVLLWLYQVLSMLFRVVWPRSQKYNRLMMDLGVLTY